MNDFPVFIMLVGVPGSGKSTLIANVLKNIDDWVIISSDNILDELAKAEGIDYGQAFKKYINVATSQMQRQLQQAISNRSNIIWDQTNLTQKSRRKKLAQIPKQYQKFAIAFPVSREIALNRCIERERTTKKHISSTLLDTMLSRYEVPTTSEGFEKVLIQK